GGPAHAGPLVRRDEPQPKEELVFEALVITLREGVEAALVLAIASGLLRRQGRGDQVGALLAGAGVALVVSAVLAVLATRITYNEEIVEGVGMLGAAAVVLAVAWWVWRGGGGGGGGGVGGGGGGGGGG